MRKKHEKNCLNIESAYKVKFVLPGFVSKVSSLCSRDIEVKLANVIKQASIKLFVSVPPFQQECNITFLIGFKIAK